MKGGEIISVYKLVFTNKRQYVGKASDPVSRWQNGDGYRNHHELYTAIKRFGWMNIEKELVYQGDEETLYEKIYIAKAKCLNFAYNVHSSGSPCFSYEWIKRTPKALTAFKPDVVGDFIVSALISSDMEQNDYSSIRNKIQILLEEGNIVIEQVDLIVDRICEFLFIHDQSFDGSIHSLIQRRNLIRKYSAKMDEVFEDGVIFHTSNE